MATAAGSRRGNVWLRIDLWVPGRVSIRAAYLWAIAFFLARGLSLLLSITTLVEAV